MDDDAIENLGKPIHTDVTDETVTYYYERTGQLVIGEYDRRSTITTYRVAALPKSLS